MTDREQEPPAPQPHVLSDEEIKSLLRADIDGQLQALVAMFVPNVDRQQLPKLLEHLVHEQLVIRDQVLPAIAERPDGELWIHVVGPGGVEGNFQAKKLIASAGRDPGLGLCTALLYAFLFYPAARGLLRLHGFHYDFREPTKKEPSKLILLK